MPPDKDVVPGSEEEINNSMEDLEAAWAASEESSDGGEQPAETADVPAAEESSAEAGEAEAGDRPAGEEAGKESGGEAETDSEAAQQAPEEKPPVSWRADARETWKELPEKARQEILKRERDYAAGIQQNSEAAQWARQFNNVLQPFRPMFSANGQDDVSGVRGVLQTAATLQMGSTAQKVKAVGDIISQFGVDIQALDQYLAEGHVGPQEGQGGYDPRIEQMLSQRLAPYEQFIQQVQHAQQNAQQQQAVQAHQTVAQFSADPKNEFYHDVKNDMADLLDLAAARGQNLSLQDAYQRACMMNPQVAGVIQARQQGQGLQRKRAAASSVSGAPRAPTAPPNPETTRDAISAAWDALEGGA